MSSPFVVAYEDRMCTEKKCEPFFIREWETMLVGTLICAALIYLMILDDQSEQFSKHGAVYDRRANSQRQYVVDERPGHDSEQFATRGAVAAGRIWPSSGAATSKFANFATIDSIDHAEQAPMHKPETSDSALEHLIR